MSLGGGQTISPVADSNKYAQIMELMRMRQNMTPGSSYTGGFNSSAPASVSAAPSSYYEELLRQQALLNANSNRGGGRGEPAEPGYAAPSTQSFAEGLASAGVNYGNVLGGLLPGGFVAKLLGNAYINSRLSDAAQNGGYTGTYTGDAAFGDRPNNTMTEAQTQAAIDGTGGGPLSGEAWGGGGGGGYAKGGKVTMDRLRGPNPTGPDDGYAGLKNGEFVINAKSVGKYGIELMNAINAGKISKGKLRGLLEG